MPLINITQICSIIISGLLPGLEVKIVVDYNIDKVDSNKCIYMYILRKEVRAVRVIKAITVVRAVRKVRAVIGEY